jgi:orotate phosphoribosyltransferase-like protein
MPKLIKKSTEIIELYNEGFSLREIANEYNVDHATIKLLLTRNNVPLRNTRTYKLSEE